MMEKSLPEIDIFKDERERHGRYVARVKGIDGKAELKFARRGSGSHQRRSHRGTRTDAWNRRCRRAGVVHGGGRTQERAQDPSALPLRAGEIP
jgi:hypothetical protein